MIPPSTFPIARRVVSSFVIGVALASLAGCATLFVPERQPVPVASDPSGAQVYVDGEPIGLTPLTLELERDRAYDVVLSLDGRTREVTLQTGVDGAYVALDVAPGLALAALSGVALASVTRADEDPLGVMLVGPPALAGIAGGLAGAGISVAVDASSGRWRRLSPSEIVVAFDGP